MEHILLKTELTLEIVGEAEVFDEENSIWDGEDREYIFRENANKKFKGMAEVECEIEINFGFDNLDLVGFRALNLLMAEISK